MKTVVQICQDNFCLHMLPGGIFIKFDDSITLSIFDSVFKDVMNLFRRIKINSFVFVLIRLEMDLGFSNLIFPNILLTMIGEI